MNTVICILCDNQALSTDDAMPFGWTFGYGSDPRPICGDCNGLDDIGPGAYPNTHPGCVDRVSV